MASSSSTTTTFTAAAATTTATTTSSSARRTSEYTHHHNHHHHHQGPPRAGDNSISLSLQEMLRCGQFLGAGDENSGNSGNSHAVVAGLFDTATFLVPPRPLAAAAPANERPDRAPHDPYLRRLYVASIIGEALKIMEEEEDDGGDLVFGLDNRSGTEQVPEWEGIYDASHWHRHLHPSQ